MHADAFALWPSAPAFLLTLARVGSAFAFLPMPGWRGAPDLARVALILALSVSLARLRDGARLPATSGALVLWMMGELAFGLAAGLIVAFVSEGLLLAAQTVSTQAGYSFATTFDPSSQADSGVLQLFMTLGANLLFFAAGLDHAILRVFAASLERWPAGGIAGIELAGTVIRFGAVALESGLRLAVPIAGFLFLTDLFLALAGRLHAQLQLLSVAFPVKMLAALAGLAMLAPVVASLFFSAAAKSERALGSLLR